MPKQFSVTLFKYLICSCRGKYFTHCALSLSLLSHALWISSKVNIPFVYLSCSVPFLCRLCTEASVPGARLIFDALLWLLIRVRNGGVEGMRVTSGEKNMGWKNKKTFSSFSTFTWAQLYFERVRLTESLICLQSSVSQCQGSLTHPPQ